MEKNSKILIACEESGIVLEEFKKLGFTNVWSCDLLPTSGNFPEWHIQGDVLNITRPHPTGNGFGYKPYINFITMDGSYTVLDEKWDMIIAFPPCTYLTVTGNRWFNIERYGEKAIQRYKDREDAIKFFMEFANADCPRIAIENPIGIMSTEYKKPSQIIQPWQFGDAFEKTTCLWLKGLPNLISTKIVEPPARTQFKSGKTMASWYSDCFKLSPAERSIARSKTFPGIAKAMATQWG